MSRKIFIGMTIDPAVVERVDTARGMVPRSAFVEKVLKDSLGSREG